MKKYKQTMYVMGVALLFGILFWVIDGVVNFYFFRGSLRFMIFERPETVIESVIFRISPYTMFVRVSVLIACLLGGMLTALFLQTKKKAEEILFESKEKFRMIAETSIDIIYQLDREGTITYASPSVSLVLGYSPEEVMGTNSADYTELDEIPGVAEMFLQAFGGHNVELLELTLRAKNGNFVDIETNAVPMRKDGLIIGVQGIARDITERKHSEAKIREYSENLEKMVEERAGELNRALEDAEEARDRIDGILKSVADGLIVTDNYYNIILMNRAAENLLGVRFSELIGRPVDFIIKDKTLRYRIMPIMEKKESELEFDFELPRDDTDNPRIMRARTSVIEDKSGKETGIIAIIHDVTYEREVDRMKTEFISTAAHELRTPLTSIQGFSELLMTRDDFTLEERKKFLSYINRQSESLAKIIGDLLDISRIEAGKGFILNKASTCISHLIGDVISYLEARSQGHRFETEFFDEFVEVAVDRDKIVQVLENILSNSVKYSPDGGLIRIRGEVDDDHYHLSVEDEGIGMTPEQVEKVFDKFYRVDASDAAVPGTGLGMSIVQHIIEAHGGKVWVESEFGKGTTVHVSIPMHDVKNEL